MQGSGRCIAKYTTGEIDSPAVSFPITASVSLNKIVLSASVDLSLKRPNRAPTLVVLDTDSKEIKDVAAPVVEGDSITFNLSAVDPDGDQVRFSIEASRIHSGAWGLPRQVQTTGNLTLYKCRR